MRARRLRQCAFVQTRCLAAVWFAAIERLGSAGKDNGGQEVDLVRADFAVSATNSTFCLAYSRIVRQMRSGADVPSKCSEA
jgi:hypothetical protein